MFSIYNQPHCRTSLRLKRGSFAYASAGSTASVARQVSQEYQAALFLSRAALPFDVTYSFVFFSRFIPNVTVGIVVCGNSFAKGALLQATKASRVCLIRGVVVFLCYQASMLSSKHEDPKNESRSDQARTSRRGTMVNRRAGLKTALNLAMRTPKPQSLPSYLVKVLLSLVQARLEAKVKCPDGWCRKCRSYTPFISPCCLAKGFCVMFSYQYIVMTAIEVGRYVLSFWIYFTRVATAVLNAPCARTLLKIELM